MTDERSAFEKSFLRYEPDGGSFERLRLRHDRKRRNQRIAAGVVGIAVFVAAVWIVTSVGSVDRSETSVVPGGDATGPAGSLVPNSTGVNVINLPPEGSPPSFPEHGELVLYVDGRGIAADRALTRMYLYADGRLIWWREGDLPAGATGHDILEQRLTPEGVELVRSEVIGSGLIDNGIMVDGQDDPDPLPFWGGMGVRNGDRLVGRDFQDESPPQNYTIATAEQERALERLDARLTDLASWLPASAWADQGIKTYVPTTYRVCYGGTQRTIKRDRLLHAIPGPVQELLEARDAEENDDFSMYLSFDRWVNGVRVTGYCSELTTEEARDVVRDLDDGGFERLKRPAAPKSPDYASGGGGTSTFEYIFSVSDSAGSAALWIDPNLPHGTVCIVC
jgi:hypothetical protein